MEERHQQFSTVVQAAAQGALYVRKGFLTRPQLNQALDAVKDGENFEVFILGKRWVTEAEIDCIAKNQEACPNYGSAGHCGQCLKEFSAGSGNSLGKVATVVLNRAIAHQREVNRSVQELGNLARLICTKAGGSECGR